MSDICVFGCFFFQEFAGEDMSDLFLEEREMAIRQAQDEKRKLQMAVPGILGPHEIPEEMQDWTINIKKVKHEKRELHDAGHPFVSVRVGWQVLISHLRSVMDK